MPAVGDAGIGGNPAQLEKAILLGDDFVNGRRSDDANAFIEPVHNWIRFKGSGLGVKG